MEAEHKRGRTSHHPSCGHYPKDLADMKGGVGILAAQDWHRNLDAYERNQN